jgi:chromatin remodeling complex protein RSC6
MPVKKAPVSAPVATPVAPAKPAAKSVVPAATAAPVEVKEEVVESPFLALEDKMSQLSAVLKEVNLHLKTVKKEYERLKKTADKVERKRANARSTPNGFAKPTKISDELCVFLGVPKGTEKSRTEVTREINKYVKAKNLSDPKNKRIIRPDATLKKLLNSTDKDEVTYFNLQKFLKHHFVKVVVA